MAAAYWLHAAPKAVRNSLFLTRITESKPSSVTNNEGKQKEVKLNLCFFLFFCLSLAAAEGTFARKRKEKQVFLLLFARLFVPLHCPHCLLRFRATLAVGAGAGQR
jgi:hypothetical protein